MKQKTTRKVAFLILSIGIIILATFGIGKIIRHFQIDACLDKGGTWNYELNECETEEKARVAKDTSFYWYIAADTILHREYLIRGHLIDEVSHSPADLIAALNKRDTQCKIEYIDLLNDTLHVRILNDEFLSEQMGSTGAYCYLGETVYTLTEHDSIEWVKIDMQVGSHASPGVFGRANFKELKRK